MSQPLQVVASTSALDRDAYALGLWRISRLDGREVLRAQGLEQYLSEAALHQYRAAVEIELLIAWSKSDLPVKPAVTSSQRSVLRSLVSPTTFDPMAVAEYDHFGRKGIAPVEHDVKAVELYLRELLAEHGLTHLLEWIHFAATSEDINNLAWNLMLRDGINMVWLPATLSVMDQLALQAQAQASIPVIGRTHGMKASPTTIGKRFSYVLGLMMEVLAKMKQLTLSGKFGGAVGNHNPIVALFPDFAIRTFSRVFVECFRFTYTENTHQRNDHVCIVRLLNEINLLNAILVDLCELVRHSVTMGWLYQEGNPDHTGSSVMPWKVNPWFFEVAQGILEGTIALINGASMGLIPSLFERDLSDHPWERAYGEMIGGSLVGLRYVVEGLQTLKVNPACCERELAESPEVLSELVQIAGRVYGLPNIYMTIKQLTRGKVITREILNAIIIDHLPSGEQRDRLLSTTPEQYIGAADRITLDTVEEYRQSRGSIERGLLDFRLHICAVLFDFDGTLQLGDKDELIARLGEINRRMALEFSDEELRDIGDRSDWREMCQLAVSRYNAKQPENLITESLFRAVNQEVSGQLDHHFRLADSAAELLVKLKQSWRQIGLVTTRGSNSLTRLLNRHGITQYFDVIIDRDCCSERKPHPAPLALALQRLNIANPKSVLYVGDNQVDDVIAGNALGVQTALINNQPLEPFGARPTYRFDSLRHLSEWWSLE